MSKKEGWSVLVKPISVSNCNSQISTGKTTASAYVNMETPCDTVEFSSKNNKQEKQSFLSKSFGILKKFFTAIFKAIVNLFSSKKSSEEVKTEDELQTEPQTPSDTDTKVSVDEKPAVEEATESDPYTGINSKRDIKIPRTEDLSAEMNKSLDFAEDLTSLVNKENATPEEIQKAVRKHYDNDNIYVHSMSEYEKFGPAGLNKEHKAATTRPSFDENGKLQRIDVFLPDLDYSNPHAKLSYLENACHEFTHVGQYVNKDCSDRASLRSDLEGKLMFFIQKSITDKFTDKMGLDAIKGFIAETGSSMKGLSDYDKFIDSPSANVTPEHIGEILKIGSTKEEQSKNINAIFDIMFDSFAVKFNKDPNFINAVLKRGSLQAFKDEIKQNCSMSLKDEQEAYKAGQMVRQSINGTSGSTTHNDVINIIMGICADSLK